MEHRGGSQSHGLIPAFEEGRSRGPTIFLELLLGCSLVQRVQTSVAGSQRLLPRPGGRRRGGFGVRECPLELEDIFALFA